MFLLVDGQSQSTVATIVDAWKQRQHVFLGAESPA